MITITPRKIPWWRRGLCRIGIHREQLRLVPGDVLDGTVLMPDHFLCLDCGHRRVHPSHTITPGNVCRCDTCREAQTIGDPRLETYNNLYIFGSMFGRPWMAAIHRATIETHPLYQTSRSNGWLRA
jgi:hypothetical protein